MSSRYRASTSGDTGLKLATDLLARARAVLFDFNGTLSLDEKILEESYESALATLHLPGMGPGEYARLMGRSELDICRALLMSRGATVPSDQLLDALADSYLHACRACSPVPATHRRLVRSLARNGIACAVATGTIRSMVEPVLADASLTPLLRFVVTVEDVDHGKPDPESFLLARSLLGLPPEAICVVVEDSRAGIDAASRAGMPSISVRPGVDGASATVPSLAALGRAWSAR